MHSCVIGALGPFSYQEQKRHALNISIIRIGSTKKIMKCSPCSPYEKPPIVASLGSLILPNVFSLDMVPYNVEVLGLGRPPCGVQQ